MPDANDMGLLKEYVRDGSETAFAELVRRHIDLVYSVALRHAGVTAHAQEITQTVFIVLARRAAGLRENTILEGWLYGTTRLTALSFLRGERRRQFREQEAYVQSTLQEPTDHLLWNQLGPLLDEAMSQLGKKDRDAVILRFFKDQAVHEVATAMQTSDAAAQRRILRALEKLRKFFVRRGVSSTAAIIAVMISTNSIQAAPVGLAKTVSAVAIAKGAAVSTSTLTLIKGALKIMAWTKIKTAAAIGVVIILAAGTTGLAVKHHRHANHPAPGAEAGFSKPSNLTLEGHWKGTNSAHPGQSCSLNISGDQIEYRGADPNDWLRGTFVLNENANPKQLNLTILEPVKGFVLCLYQADGDKITIAAAEHGTLRRPSGFSPSHQVDVLELQRE
jgi:RNA polymerase sigma factor (sigma-70 family)